MDVVGKVFALFFASLTFSVLALPFSVLPPGVVAFVLRAQDEHWMIVDPSDNKEHRVRYVLIGICGGLLGEVLAIASLFFGEDWICYTQQQLCHDGQGGLLLIFTIPVFSLLVSVLLIGWTWLHLKVPGHSQWAATTRYSGRKRITNRICSAATQFVLLVIFAALVFRLTLAIL